MRVRHISCKYCGARIQMREIAVGRWRPFDGFGGPHACRPNAAITRRAGGKSYDLAAVDGVSRRASIQPGGAPATARSLTAGDQNGTVSCDNEIFASLARQLRERSW